MPDAVTEAVPSGAEAPLPLVEPTAEVVTVCRSADAMLDFYTRVLGLRQRALMGRPGAGIYRLTAGRSVLQLADAGRKPPSGDGGATGVAELTVAVDDIDGVLERAGARASATSSDRLTVWRTEDPDGNAVRVVAGQGLTDSPCRLHVSLAAVDVDATLSFYRQALRLPAATAGDPLLADPTGALAGDMRIGVRPAPPGATPFEHGPWAATGLRYLVGVVRDANDFHATLASRGVPFAMDLRHDGPKDAFAVADPDGTWFEFVSMAAKGADR